MDLFYYEYKLLHGPDVERSGTYRTVFFPVALCRPIAISGTRSVAEVKSGHHQMCSGADDPGHYVSPTDQIQMVTLNRTSPSDLAVFRRSRHAEGSHRPSSMALMPRSLLINGIN
jgi:hypothetical protein